MKKFITAGLLILAVCFSGLAQKKQGVLLTIGKDQITLDDFLRIYERNNSNIQDSANRKTAKEYLQLYINFKLKVQEAKSLGLDTAAAFRNELAGYRHELAVPYLSDVSFDEKQLEETYQRMLKEVNASHIMIMLAENASPKDTLAAFTKISNIRNEIAQGLNFNEAAVKYSQDPSAKTNRGDLGWFTVFQMVYPFETAAYNTPVGQVSAPFRTRFGYHILKVNGIRDAEGEIHVAHIMKMYPQNATPEQKNIARQKADSIYALLLKGADFAELAKKTSDDQRSAEKGGEMPWFSKNRMIAEFSNPAFALEKNGDISKPVDSGFGYHIIKRLDLRPVPKYAEIKRELEQRMKQDKDRNRRSQDFFVSKLKKEYNFTSDQTAIDEILENTSASLKKEKPEIPSTPEKDQQLFAFDHTSVSSLQWFDYLKKQEISSIPTESQKLTDFFKSFEDEKLMEYEDTHLEEKYPEFKSLMEEYHDGMLLFDISEKKVWQKASADTTGLEKFYETNKQKYMWPERFKGEIIHCSTGRIKEETEKYLDMDIPVREIYDMMSLRPENILVTDGAWAKNENPIVDYYCWKGMCPADWNDRIGFIHGKIIPPEPKLLSETRGYHIADYQQYLEDQWIKELHKNYRVQINKKLLKRLPNV